jgi:hypothetical protein
MQIRTLRMRVDAADGVRDLAADIEPYQPSYARYWLNNTGPAPRGNLPVTMHTEPSLVDYDGGPVELVVRVASDRSTAAEAAVTVVVPEGWTAEPSRFEATVPGGEFAEQSVTVVPSADLADGSWWIRVRAAAGAETVEDVTRVLVGSVTEPELSVDVTGPGPLEPGASGSIDVRLSSSARSEISAQVQLISPWHTWELLPSWDTGALVAPGASATVSVPVQVPLGTEPGTWWVLAKVAAAGALHYTEPVSLVVSGP